VNLVRSGRKQP